MSALSRLAPGVADFHPQADAPPFVGREAELRLLETALDEALDGQAQVLFLRGDAGIGKTRLLRELRSAAEARGARVCYGRCYEGLTLPYLPFVVSLLNQLEALAVPSHGPLADEVRIIEAFLRGTGPALTAEERPSGAESDHDRLRVFLAIAHLTVALAQAKPLLFVVDDLHWADQASLDLFGHLAFSIADAAQRERVPLLIVGSHRGVEPEHPLARVLVRGRREAICRTIDLSGLDGGEIDALVRGLGLSRPPQYVVKTIQDATSGNPLFIQEVVHQLRRMGAVDAAGRYRAQRIAVGDLQLPSEVTASIAARFRELRPAVQELLTFAAVLGEGFTLPLLSAVTEQSEDAVLAVLEEARQQHLLVSGGEQFQFAHPLIRAVLYRAPSAPQRQRLHLRVADVLEQLRQDGDYDADLEIAHHLIEAGRSAPAERTLLTARRAGSRALALYAWNAAARFFDAARTAAQPAGTASPHDLAELRYWSGYAHYRAMDVSASGELFAEAMAGFRVAGNTPGMARALIDRTRLQLAHGAIGVGTPFDLTALEEALSGLGESEAALRGELLAEIADVCWVVRQEARAQEASREALAIGRRIGDDGLATHAHFSLAMIQWQSLQLADSFENFSEAAACARRAGDPWNESAALARRPLVLLGLGRLNEAEAAAQEGLELGRAVNDWAEYSLALSAVELVALARGDLAAAERTAQQVMRMAERSQYPWSGVQALTSLAAGRACAGLWAEAEDAIAISVEPGRLFPDAGPVLRAGAAVYQQLIRAYAGETARVRAELAANPQLSRTPHHADLFALSGICALVEIAARIAEPALAAQAYPALLGAAANGAQLSGTWPFLLPRVLGLAATLGRDWNAAERHFEQALELGRRAALDAELGRTGLDYARMLVARGGRGDRDRAAQLLHQAIPWLYDAQLRPFAREAQTLAAALHADLPDPPPSAGRAQPLSERERSIVAGLARGRLEAEIADDLLLRPQTVAGFINGLCARTGTTRQTLPAYMRDHGWLSPPAVADVRPALRLVPAAAAAEQPAARGGLSVRELEVLQLVAAGKTNREIADALVISPRTVETHVLRIYEKIGAANRAEAAAYAVRQGLTAP